MKNAACANPDSISVIVPVYNGASVLPQSLAPLMSLLNRGEVIEVIVVDDGSSDESARIARDFGATVLQSGGRLGPGGARNVAARAAAGRILWFVDADVVVHPDGASRIQTALQDPTVMAVFGSYDDRPPAMNFGSQYKNLVHHHYHHAARREASTFWAGCGAVRKQTFLSLGGFDSERYSVPSIEDVELGYRLRQAGGRICFEKRLLGTHLKRWSLYDLVRTDIFRRALPWARLMLSRSGVIDDLNVSWPERLRAGAAGLFVMTSAAGLVGAVPLWVPMLLLLAVYAINAKLFALFARRQGIVFAAMALLFHQVYYCYSTIAFLWCWVEARLGKSEAR